MQRLSSCVWTMGYPQTYSLKMWKTALPAEYVQQNVRGMALMGYLNNKRRHEGSLADHRILPGL